MVPNNSLLKRPSISFWRMLTTKYLCSPNVSKKLYSRVNRSVVKSLKSTRLIRMALFRTIRWVDNPFFISHSISYDMIQFLLSFFKTLSCHNFKTNLINKSFIFHFFIQKLVQLVIMFHNFFFFLKKENYYFKFEITVKFLRDKLEFYFLSFFLFLNLLFPILFYFFARIL